MLPIRARSRTGVAKPKWQGLLGSANASTSTKSKVNDAASTWQRLLIDTTASDSMLSRSRAVESGRKTPHGSISNSERHVVRDNIGNPKLA